MDPVVHFEMPYEDGKRMAKFYEAVFGWDTQMLGEEMGSYVLATTTETAKAGPKKRGRINGGFYPKKPDWPAQYPSVVIAVNNVKVSMKRVIKQGGTLLVQRVSLKLSTLESPSGPLLKPPATSMSIIV